MFQQVTHIRKVSVKILRQSLIFFFQHFTHLDVNLDEESILYIFSSIRAILGVELAKMVFFAIFWHF